MPLFNPSQAVNLKVVPVADEEHRFLLTSPPINNLDWIEQQDTGDVFGVIDTGNLGSDVGYCHLGYITPRNTVAPTLSTDSPHAGETITVNHGTWNATPSAYGYQWQVSADGISGWTGATGTGPTTANYIPANGEVGSYLRCGVTATNSNGTSEPVYVMATNAIAASTLESGLEADWQFNDLTDSSGNGHTLTNNNGVVVGSGQAVFDATNSQSLVPASPASIWGNSFSWCIEGYIAGDTGTTQVLLGIFEPRSVDSESPDVSPTIQQSAIDGSLLATIQTGSSGSVAANSTILPSSANKIRVRYNDSTGTIGIKVNDEVEQTASWSAGQMALLGTPTVFMLSADPGDPLFMTCTLGRTRVWNRCLTDDEFNSL